MNAPLKRPHTITYNAIYALDPTAPAGQRCKLRGMVDVGTGRPFVLEVSGRDERDADEHLRRDIESIFLRRAEAVVQP